MRQFAKTIVYIQIFLYIVLGNAFTINIGNRAPIKIAEIFSIIPIICYFAICKIYLKKMSFYTKFICGFLLIDIISIGINTFVYHYTSSEIFYGLIYLARIIHIFFLAYVIYKLAQISKIRLSKLLKFINFCFLLVCFIGVIQYFLFPVAQDWYDVLGKIGFYWADPDPHYGRLVSTYMDPNYLASILIIPFTINLCYLLFQRHKIVKYPYIISSIILLITIVLSQSRSGLVGAFVSLVLMYFVYASKRKYKAKYVIIALMFMIVLTVLIFTSDITVFVKIRNFANDNSANHRFDSWAESFDYIKDNFLFGVGYNTFSSYLERLNVEIYNTSSFGLDSSVLFLFVTTGIFGFILFLVATYKIITLRGKNALNIAIKISYVSSLVISFFNNLLFNTLWLFPFLFIILLAKKNNHKAVQTSEKRELDLKGVDN